MNCFLCQELHTSFPSYIDHLTIYHGTPPGHSYKCTACIPSVLYPDIYRFKRHITGQHFVLFESTTQSQYEACNTPLDATQMEADTSYQNNEYVDNRAETILSDFESEKKSIENQHLNEETILDLSAKLREKVFNFSLNLYSKANLTRKDVIDIQTSITEEIVKPVIEVFSSLASMPESGYKQKLINDLKDPFKFIGTEHKFNNTTHGLGLSDSFQIVDFEDNEGRVKSNGCLMPIKQQMKAFLESPGLFDKTLENMNSLEQDENSSNVVNTSLWKSVKEQITDVILMPYFLYSDEAEMNDAIGAHSGTHKVCSLYYSFPTIPSHFLSRLDNIFVAGFVKASDMAEFGPSKALHDLVDFLVDLEANGMNLQIEHTTYKVHFVLMGILGDNLGINTLMGYSTSFSSLHYCRFCKINKYDAQSAVILDKQLNRSMKDYEVDLQKPYKETGIKENSEFNRLEHFLPSFSILKIV